MSAKEKKEKKKKHYVKAIGQNEPIRPSELPFKRVRYDYLDELEAEGRIGRKKYFPRDSKRKITGYTLLFMPEHENLADERFYNKSVKKEQIPFHYQKPKKELQLDFTQLIEKWLNQLPYNISIWGGILERTVHEEEMPYTGYLPVNVKDNPLFSDFKRYAYNLLKEHPDFLHSNPIIEWEKFKENAKVFLEKREKLMEEITEIIVNELINKKGNSNRDIEVFDRVNGNIEVPMELIEGILYMLDRGVKWKSGEFSADWFKEFVRFNSYVSVFPESYGYYIRKLEETIRYSEKNETVADISEAVEEFPKYYIFIASVRKEEQSENAFNTEMDKRIERMLSKIEHSKRIKEATLELWKEKEGLFNILNNIHASLEKIKNIK